MSDPTAIAIIASLAAAFGLFTLTAIGRALAGKMDPVPEVLVEEPSLDLSPYLPSIAAPEAPAPPSEKVPTWFFNPLDLVGLAILFLVFSYLVISSLAVSGDPVAKMNPEALIAAIGFQFVIAGIVAAMVLPRVGIASWLGLKWRKWPLVFLIAPGGVIFMWLFFSSLQFSGYMRWIQSFGVDGVQDTVKLLQQSDDPTLLGLMAAAAVLVAPICEEIVFRGYLYGASKRFVGPWVACICSALVFSCAHASLAALLPLFAFGCLLAFIYQKSGSIWAPMAVHFLFNGATVLVQLAVRYYHLPLPDNL